MSMKEISFAIVLLLLLAVLVLIPEMSESQDSTLDNIVRYFPSGEYHTILHADLDHLNKVSSSRAFYKVFGKYCAQNHTLNLFLPLEFQKGIESYSWAEKMNMKVALLKREAGKWQLLAGEKTAGFKPGGMDTLCCTFGDKGTVYFTSDAQRMWVIRYFDLVPVINKSFQSGSLVDTETTINDGKVYRIAKNKMKEEYFAYPTFNNELLVAENIETLQTMIAVGNGEEYGILADDLYKDLSSYEQELGHFWLAKSSPNQAIVKKYQDNKQSLFPLALEAYEKIASDSKNMTMKYNVMSVHAEDEISEVRYRIFDDNESARKHLENLRNDKSWQNKENAVSDEFYQLNSSKKMAQKVKLDGNNIVISVLFNKKLVNQSVNQDKAFRKYVKEMMKKIDDTEKKQTN